MQVCKVFGNNVIVDLSYHQGQKVVYFPTNGQLSVEFCTENNLVRKKDENGNNIGGYLDPNKRNVTTIKLRGEISDGLVLPVESLAKFTDISKLKNGDKISILNGVEICKKYIPVKKSNPNAKSGNKGRKKREPIAPLFAEHVDTQQLAYNLGTFSVGDEIEITLKCHGSSQRTAHLPVFQGYKRTIKDKIFKRMGTPIYDWDYVTGTRRTVLEDFRDCYYGNDSFRKESSEFFEGKLEKGETVYYEVVGFLDSGKPIMPSCDNKKLNDKEFVRKYGKTTTFSYGCSPEEGCKQNDFYVYRMTMTNEDGYVVEYPPDLIRTRCEQMGCKTVPVLWRGFIEQPDSTATENFNAGKYIKDIAECYYEGPDPIGKSHIREGVVVRVTNKPKFCAYKHKGYEFKCLEGIIKANAAEPDIEEAQEVENEQF